MIFVITSIITVVFVKDRSCQEAKSGKEAERLTIKDALHVIGGNDQPKVFIGIVLCYNLVVQLAGGIAIYYFKYVTGNEGLYPIFTTAAQFAEIAALFLFPTFLTILQRNRYLQLPVSALQLVSQELYFVDSLHHRTW